MPTEFRFDDLDLREEPVTPGRDKAEDSTSMPALNDATTYQCTRICCV